MTIEKGVIIQEYQRAPLDTGSSEVQIALMTARIELLTSHFKIHKKDHHSKRGLIGLVSTRRKLLKYLKKTNKEKYLKTIQSLGLRK